MSVSSSIASRSGAQERMTARERRTRFWQMVQLVPIMAILVLLFGGALVLAILQSLGFAPWFGVNTFPDFSYFGALWGSSTFWVSLGLTLYYATVSTVIALILGILLALALVKTFPSKTFYKYLYKLPLMIPYTVGIALAVLMLSNGGMLSRLAVYAVLLGIGRETEEAAAILGANRRTIFFRVTLPQILPGVVSSTLICFAFNVGAFEAPFILGGGFPDTLPVVAWRYFNDADYTLQLQGMATVVSIGLVAGVILFGYLAAYRRYERRMGRN